MAKPKLRVRHLTALDQDETLTFNGTAENAAGQESRLTFVMFADYDVERRDKYRQRLASLFAGLHETDNGGIRVVSLTVTAKEEGELAIEGEARRGNGTLDLNKSFDGGDRVGDAYQQHFGRLFEDVLNDK